MNQEKELAAVNRMLLSIGEQPISSLEDVQDVDARIAHTLLLEVSRSVQMQDWHFNAARRVTLTPDRQTQEIFLPRNCLRVDSTGRHKTMNIVQRGSRLFDQGANTFKFKSPVVVDMLLQLPIEELPPVALDYIQAKATRRFQQSVAASMVLEQFTQEAELEALAALKQADTQNGDYNLLYGSREIRRAVARDRSI